MSLAMPEPIHAYFAAEQNEDVEALLGCFVADAVVHDEKRSHQGHAEIRAWWTDVKAKTPYGVEPLSSRDSAESCIVTARVSGSFPGSPVTLHFAFGLAEGRIQQLRIQP